MDYWGVVRQAWAVSRRTRPLWWLGIISAVQLIAYTLVVSLLSIPVFALPQAFVVLSTAQDAASAGEVDRFITLAADYISRFGPPVLAGFLALMAIWLVTGVFDVAAQPGLITQATESVEGRRASVRAGMSDGFRLWWRTVGLLVLSALPALLYVLLMSVAGLFTVSLPLFAHKLPDPNVIALSYRMLSPLSAVVTVVTIPLGIWVQLALRFAVLDDLEVRAALAAAWRLMKSQPAEVFLCYLVLAVISMIASVPLSVAIVIIAVVVVGVSVSAGIAGGAASVGTIVASTAVGVLLVTVLLFAYSAIWFVYQSVAWTLFWRRFTGRDPRRPDASPTTPAETSPEPAIAPGGALVAEHAATPLDPASSDAFRRDDL